MYALINGKIFTGDKFIYNHAVIIDKTMIIDILPLDNVDSNYQSIEKKDVDQAIICPGFIDLQLNGCGGVLFNDDTSANTLKTMHETNLKFGTTSFLPTLITTTDEQIKQAVQVVKEYHKKNKFSIIGIHIEGPYISKIKKGIHNPHYIKEIPNTMVEFLCNEVKNVPIKITMAPEENSSYKIKQLTDAGVIVSIGHTNGTYEQIKEAITNGATLATHLFNAMSAFEGRSTGAVGAILNSPNIYSGIIADGYHVNFSSLELVKKIKKDKLYIVTDAVTPMGTNMNHFRFADQYIFVKDGKCTNESGTLAGANIDMLSSIKNVVQYTDISLSEALRMASLYPAYAIGFKNILGRIAKNWIANIAIITENLVLKATIDNGKYIEL